MPLVKSSSLAMSYEGVESLEGGHDGLAVSLRSDDKDIRRKAARQATQIKAANLLAEALATETDNEIREILQTSLIRCGGPAAVRPLIELLRSEDAGLRNGVIETLQCMGDAAVPEIELALGDKDPDVRIFAVNILLSLQSTKVPDIALRVLLNDTNVNVCAAALDVIAETGRPDMRVALKSVPGRFPDRPFLAFAISSVLKRIG